MTYLIVAIYLIGAALFGWWQVAMDARYGVQPGASTSVVPMIALSAAWPIGVPLALASVAGGGWGRWSLRS